MATATAPATTFRVTVPDHVIESLQKQAEERGISLEELASQRLLSTHRQDAQKPLYFNDEQRQRLDELTGRNIKRADEALIAIRSALTVRVDSVPIPLDPVVLERLHSRCETFKADWKVWLAEQVKLWAEQYVGLR